MRKILIVKSYDLFDHYYSSYDLFDYFYSFRVTISKCNKDLKSFFWTKLNVVLCNITYVKQVNNIIKDRWRVRNIYHTRTTRFKIFTNCGPIVVYHPPWRFSHLENLTQSQMFANWQNKYLHSPGIDPRRMSYAFVSEKLNYPEGLSTQQLTSFIHDVSTCEINRRQRRQGLNRPYASFYSYIFMYFIVIVLNHIIPNTAAIGSGKKT